MTHLKARLVLEKLKERKKKNVGKFYSFILFLVFRFKKNLIRKKQASIIRPPMKSTSHSFPPKYVRKRESEQPHINWCFFKKKFLSNQIHTRSFLKKINFFSQKSFYFQKSFFNFLIFFLLFKWTKQKHYSIMFLYGMINYMENLTK